MTLMVYARGQIDQDPEFIPCTDPGCNRPIYHVPVSRNQYPQIPESLCKAHRDREVYRVDLDRMKLQEHRRGHSIREARERFMRRQIEAEVADMMEVLAHD